MVWSFFHKKIPTFQAYGEHQEKSTFCCGNLLPPLHWTQNMGCQKPEMQLKGTIFTESPHEFRLKKAEADQNSPKTRF